MLISYAHDKTIAYRLYHSYVGSPLATSVSSLVDAFAKVVGRHEGIRLRAKTWSSELNLQCGVAIAPANR
jgi:hypothetical protein